MMLLMNAHILIMTLFISNSNAQCTLKEYIETSYCGVNDINIYGAIPPQINNADRWAIEAGKSTAQWTFGGLALAGKIAGPVAGIASAGIGNLVGAVLGTSGNGNIDVMFQDRVNEELVRLEKCIEEKIYEKEQRDEFNEVKAFLFTFNELANETIDAGDVDQAEDEIEKFNILITSNIRPWIKRKFKNPLSNTPAIEYAYLVPVFGAFLTTYDQIISAYLNLLRECEYHDAYDAVRGECYDYGESLEEAIISVDILIQWINIALPKVKNLYDLAKIKSLDLNDRAIDQKKKYVANQVRYFVEWVKFAKNVNGEWLAKGIPFPVVSHQSSKIFNIYVDMYGTDDCKLRITDCNMDWIGFLKNEETTAGSCRDKLFDAVIGQYDDYIVEVADWELNFINQYVGPANDLKRKIQEWMTMKVPEGSEYLGCYKDQRSRAVPVNGGRGYTPETCLDFCKDYILFAVQDYDQCWCGNDIQDAIQYGVPTDCPSKFTFRGDNWTNSLFQQHVTIGNAIDSGYCIQEDGMRLIPDNNYIGFGPCNGGTNQQWIFYDDTDSDGYFRIRSVHSGQCISANVENEPFGFDTYVDLVASPCQDGDVESQRWQIKDNGEIIPKYSTPDHELCLWSAYPAFISPCTAFEGSDDLPPGRRTWIINPVHE